MGDSIWFTTRSALFQGGDAAWEAVAAYAGPLERLIARRFPWVKAQDRDDLVQDLLLEVREKLVARHEPGRGKFRALLQAVVQRRVVDLVRRRAPAPLPEAAGDALAAPPDEEVEALDLESSLVQAMAACRDRFTQGRDRDPDVLYALADRIVHGLPVAAIAKKAGSSVDRVNRLLRRGRDVLFGELLRDQLDLAAGDPRLEPLLELFRETLRRPGDAAALLEARVEDAALRERAEDLLRRFRAGVTQFAGRTDAGGELQRGLGLALEALEEA
jgi:DNA-directed RNA polymerase specialized sigma24 family protein